MTITSTVTSVTHNGNGAATSFPFAFLIPASTDISVIFTSAAGVETVKTYTTHYTATGFNDVNGGTVTYPSSGTVLATGEKLTIRRVTSVKQEVDLVTGAAFYAEVVEGAMDKLTMVGQEHAAELARCVKVDISSGVDPANYKADLASYVTASAASAATATTQASTATTQAGNAAASATTASNGAAVITTNLTAINNITTNLTAVQNASSNATTATTQAGIATTQAGNAATSASTATTQAGNASTSAAAALVSQNAAAASAAALPNAAAIGNGKVPLSNGTTWSGTTVGTGDMLAANNLSDVVNKATGRTNMGLAIGTDVQAYNANLTSLAAFTTDTDTTLAANSDTRLATQKAVKAYVTASVAAGATDAYFDIGSLYLAVARLDTPTTPNAGGTQVADEFDSAAGVGSLGSGVVGSGYLSNLVVGTVTSNVITTMTSNSGPGGTANQSASLSALYDAWKMFDSNSTTTGWYTPYGTATGWVSYTFVSPVIVVGYRITGASTTNWDVTYSPKNWTFEGWNGSTWIVLDSRTGIGPWTSAEVKTFSVSNTTAYASYRLNVTLNNGAAEIGIPNMQMDTATVTPANITTVSTAYTALTAPTTVSFVVEYQDISATAVLNTDITLEASRDGGTTWTAATLSDFGPSPIAGARVLRGSATVSGQPSGTAMKWRVKTFNAKEQRVHGVWFQWK